VKEAKMYNLLRRYERNMKAKDIGAKAIL